MTENAEVGSNEIEIFLSLEDGWKKQPMAPIDVMMSVMAIFANYDLLRQGTE